MIRRPPRSTRTDTLFPYTTLFRSDRRAALGVERDIAFPEQDGTKILAGQARQVAATAAAGFERLAAIMAFPHHLHLRGRGEHVERAVAHHRVNDLPAFVGRELEQGFVDRGEGGVGILRRLAVRGLDLDARLDGFADRIFLLVGLDLPAEPMAFPAEIGTTAG